MKKFVFLFVTLLVLCSGVTAYASETPAPPPDALQVITENPQKAAPPLSLQNSNIAQAGAETEDPPVLKDVRVVDENNQHLIVKTFEIAPDYDPDLLIEEDFKKNGYSYKKSYLLLMSENRDSQTKLASQTVTVSHDKKGEAVSKLAPLMDYAQDGFTGQLTLNLESIFTEPAQKNSYSYPITDTREFSGFERNDTYGIPKTAVKDGVTLQLGDVSWTPMGDGRYNAAATYSGSATGTTVSNYTSTATYMGQVSKNTLSSVTYAVVYEGAAIPLPPPDYLPYILATVLFCILICAGIVLFVRRKNCKILAYFGGKYNVVQRLRLSNYDPIIDLTHTNLNSKEYLVVIDRFASKRLTGQSVRIICADGTMKEHRLENNGYGCKLRLESDKQDFDTMETCPTGA